MSTCFSFCTGSFHYISIACQLWIFYVIIIVTLQTCCYKKCGVSNILPTVFCELSIHIFTNWTYIFYNLKESLYGWICFIQAGQTNFTPLNCNWLCAVLKLTALRCYRSNFILTFWFRNIISNLFDKWFPDVYHQTSTLVSI